MIIVDRLLTVRKGFAWLSLLSVPVWAMVGAGSSGDAAGLLPIEVPADTIFETVALFGASASLLLH